MTETRSQIEAAPALWPAVSGVTGDALAVAWQRVEHFIAWRFAARVVTWRVDSDGADWQPPLRPVSAVTAKLWTGAAFETVTLDLAPDGWAMPCGQYEVTATVGAGPVPPAVAAAVQRLAAYMAAGSTLPAGARSYSANVGQLSETITADPAAAARALQNSGAADLLRNFRRP